MVGLSYLLTTPTSGLVHSLTLTHLNKMNDSSNDESWKENQEILFGNICIIDDIYNILPDGDLIPSPQNSSQAVKS